MKKMDEDRPMKIFLARPRGFCAGVDRAIEIVERALKQFGPPVYVRHEIVHNRHVVESLRAKGAVFVDELEQVPENVPVIFSAHGVAKSVWAESKQRGLKTIDATCPLVIKVHHEVHREYDKGDELILIGHAGHPEVVGTMGQVPDRIYLVSSVEDVETLVVQNPDRLVYVTQTTLSIGDCMGIIQALQRRFPRIQGPRSDDICYATHNRQTAVKELTRHVELLLVIGAPNSSNSNRLQEIGCELGVRSYLIESFKDIDPAWLEGVQNVGITAGASAPEILVIEVVDFLKEHGAEDMEEFTLVEENVQFQFPAELIQPATD